MGSVRGCDSIHWSDLESQPRPGEWGPLLLFISLLLLIIALGCEAMGRQIRFYMTEADEVGFLDFLRSTGDIVIFPGAILLTRDERLDSFPARGPGRLSFQVSLYNRNVPGDLYIDPLEEREGYRLDRASSSVIEFDSTSQHEDTKVMREGRLWAEFWRLRLADPDFVRKPSQFEQWYEQVAKWIRKNYKRVDWNLFAGPGALNLHEAGWKFDIELIRQHYAKEAKRKGSRMRRR